MICMLLGELLSEIEASHPMFRFTTHMDLESEVGTLAAGSLTIYVGRHQDDHLTLWVPATLYAENVMVEDVSGVTKSYVGALLLDTLESNIDSCKCDDIYAGDFTVLQEALTVVRPFIEQQHLSAITADDTPVSINRIKI